MSHENRDAGKERLTYICFPLGKVLKLLLIFLLTQKWLFPYSTEPGCETTHRPPANSQEEKTLVLKHDECKLETLSVVSFFPSHLIHSPWHEFSLSCTLCKSFLPGQQLEDSFYHFPFPFESVMVFMCPLFAAQWRLH